MWYDVSSGQVSTGIALNNYDSMYVYDSGTANSTTVNSLGELYVWSGGTANSTTVNSIGYLSVSGTAMAAAADLNGGTQNVGGGVADQV